MGHSDVAVMAAGSISDHNHAHDHTMKMWFHSGYEEVILFDFWRIETLSGELFSVLVMR